MTFDGFGQTTDTVVMVPPRGFRFNPETAGSNAFQSTPEASGLPAADIRVRAMDEYRVAVGALTDGGVRVLELGGGDESAPPDATFPNNWFSHHRRGDGYSLVLYPMLSPQRREERRGGDVSALIESVDLPRPDVVDLTSGEQAGLFLEGTGSLVLDRIQRIAYACLSPRTSRSAVVDWCAMAGYRPLIFSAHDQGGTPVYHTNVVMAIGTSFAVAGLELITDTRERSIVASSLNDAGKEVIALSAQQISNFAANLLELRSGTREPRILLSRRALAALTDDQRRRLGAYGDFIPVDLDVIESIAGGSARCMVAEDLGP